jgi:hypothetical protein
MFPVSADNYTPAPRRGRGVYCFTSVRPSFRPSKIFFIAFFSVTVEDRNLILIGKKLAIQKQELLITTMCLKVQLKQNDDHTNIICITLQII